jgi:hypothetical protein
MSLKINTLKKHGDASEEYLILEATDNINLSDYAVVDRTYDAEGKVSNIFRHFYRFPSIQVKKGEFVSLRTSKGKDGPGTLNDNTPVHRFYWGSAAPIWNDGNVESAEVLKVATVAKQASGHPAPKNGPVFNLRPKNLKFGGK